MVPMTAPNPSCPLRLIEEVPPHLYRCGKPRLVRPELPERVETCRRHVLTSPHHSASQAAICAW